MSGSTGMATIGTRASTEQSGPAELRRSTRVDRAARLQTRAAIVALLMIAVLVLIAPLGH